MGPEHACALLDDGSVSCWGDDTAGQTGAAPAGAVASSPAPVHVDLAGSAVAMTTGGRHNCALLESGAVQCWGSNERGQLGIAPDHDPHPAPLTIPF